MKRYKKTFTCWIDKNGILQDRNSLMKRYKKTFTCLKFDSKHKILICNSAKHVIFDLT